MDRDVTIETSRDFLKLDVKEFSILEQLQLEQSLGNAGRGVALDAQSETEEHVDGCSDHDVCADAPIH